MTPTRRPLLADAPDAVRHAVAVLLGGAVVDERAAVAGFTASVASVVRRSDGQQLFVKAAPVGAGLGEAVEAGVVLAGVVGDLGPQLVGSADVDAWRVAAYEVLDGAAPTTWGAADLPPLLRVVERLRARLDPSPLPGTTPFAAAFAPLLGTWRALASWPDEVDDDPAAGSLVRAQPAAAVAHVRGRPLPVDVPVPLLAELESRWPSTLTPGTALHHGDLRRDNVVRAPDGGLTVVDWTHLWSAPGWLDLVRLGADVAACGHDPEALLRRSCWADAPPDDVDVTLAGLAGRAWREGHLPAVPAVPGLRAMQREQGLHALRWLEARLAARRR